MVHSNSIIMKKITCIIALIGLFNTTVIFANTQHHPPKNQYNSCVVRYYYYPEIDTYFDFKNEMYLFKDSGVWVRSYDLPQYIRFFNPNNFVVVPNYQAAEPYLYHFHKHQHQIIVQSSHNNRMASANHTSRKNRYNHPPDRRSHTDSHTTRRR